MPADAALLALGENAVFAGGGLVAKVGRDAALLDRARHELRVAAWLAGHGVPAVRAAEPAPRVAEGRPVTLWHRLPGATGPASPADLAVLLRVIHALPEPDFALPPRDLLGGVERWRAVSSLMPRMWPMRFQVVRRWRARPTRA
ncbi:phosphotransferase, partial [Streptomyces klenkii]|uniref:phosphotransferase n=1 Tax=Streptomyces klenkii TaxID=1420899 RepID=UPI003F4D19D1